MALFRLRTKGDGPFSNTNTQGLGPGAVEQDAFGIAYKFTTDFFMATDGSMMLFMELWSLIYTSLRVQEYFPSHSLLFHLLRLG